MWEHKEDDNLNMEEIERYMKMPQEELEKLMEETEHKIKKKSKNQRSKSICEETRKSSQVLFYYLYDNYMSCQRYYNMVE